MRGFTVRSDRLRAAPAAPPERRGVSFDEFEQGAQGRSFNAHSRRASRAELEGRGEILFAGAPPITEVQRKPQPCAVRQTVGRDPGDWTIGIDGTDGKSLIDEPPHIHIAGIAAGRKRTHLDMIINAEELAEIFDAFADAGLESPLWRQSRACQIADRQAFARL